MRRADLTGSVTSTRVGGLLGGAITASVLLLFISRNELGEGVGMKLPRVPCRLRDRDLQLIDLLKAESL